MLRTTLILAAIMGFSAQASYVPTVTCDLTKQLANTENKVKTATFSVYTHYKPSLKDAVFGEMRLLLDPSNPLKIKESVQIWPLSGAFVADDKGDVGTWEYFNSAKKGRVPSFEISSDGYFKRGETGKLTIKINKEYVQNILGIDSEDAAATVKALNGAVVDCESFI